jgi:hypothetical protein
VDVGAGDSHVRRVGAERLVLDLAQHLPGIDHLHRLFLETEVLAQRGNTADVNTSDAGAAKVHRHAVRASMLPGSALRMASSPLGTGSKVMKSKMYQGPNKCDDKTEHK